MRAYPESRGYSLPNSTQYPMDMIFTKIAVLRLGECLAPSDGLDKDRQGYEPASETLKSLGM